MLRRLDTHLSHTHTHTQTHPKPFLCQRKCHLTAQSFRPGAMMRCVLDPIQEYGTVGSLYNCFDFDCIVYLSWLGIVSGCSLVDLGQDAVRECQHSCRARESSASLGTYSLSRNSWYSSSPTLTGEPPNYFHTLSASLPHAHSSMHSPFPSSLFGETLP